MLIARTENASTSSWLTGRLYFISSQVESTSMTPTTVGSFYLAQWKRTVRDTHSRNMRVPGLHVAPWGLLIISLNPILGTWYIPPLSGTTPPRTLMSQLQKFLVLESLYSKENLSDNFQGKWWKTALMFLGVFWNFKNICRCQQISFLWKSYHSWWALSRGSSSPLLSTYQIGHRRSWENKLIRYYTYTITLALTRTLYI